MTLNKNEKQVKSEFLKGRIEHGKIGASRCNLLLTLVLIKVLFYEKNLLYIVLYTKEYEAYYYFCNNFKMSVH